MSVDGGGFEGRNNTMPTRDSSRLRVYSCSVDKLKDGIGIGKSKPESNHPHNRNGGIRMSRAAVEAVGVFEERSLESLGGCTENSQVHAALSGPCCSRSSRQ
jgi:hypothetical protein